MDIALRYGRFQEPLTAGAFATQTTPIVCPADITITKTADALSKVGDPVTYTFEICNVGDVHGEPWHRHRHALGDLTAFFPATLTPDQCATSCGRVRWPPVTLIRSRTP